MSCRMVSTVEEKKGLAVRDALQEASARPSFFQLHTETLVVLSVVCSKDMI